MVIGTQKAATFHCPSPSNKLNMETNAVRINPKENAAAAIDLGQLEQITLLPRNEIAKAVMAHPKPTAKSCDQASLS